MTPQSPTPARAALLRPCTHISRPSTHGGILVDALGLSDPRVHLFTFPDATASPPAHRGAMREIEIIGWPRRSSDGLRWPLMESDHRSRRAQEKASVAPMPLMHGSYDSRTFLAKLSSHGVTSRALRSLYETNSNGASLMMMVGVFTSSPSSFCSWMVRSVHSRLPLTSTGSSTVCHLISSRVVSSLSSGPDE